MTQQVRIEIDNYEPVFDAEKLLQQITATTHVSFNKLSGVVTVNLDKLYPKVIEQLRHLIKEIPPHSILQQPPNVGEALARAINGLLAEIAEPFNEAVRKGELTAEDADLLKPTEQDCQILYTAASGWAVIIFDALYDDFICQAQMRLHIGLQHAKFALGQIVSTEVPTTS